MLSTLHEFGADATIRIDKPGQDLRETFAHEAGNSGFSVIIDYLWGRPTEALLAAITRKEFAVVKSEIRLVQVGESAGATILLPAAVLRDGPLEPTPESRTAAPATISRTVPSAARGARATC